MNTNKLTNSATDKSPLIYARVAGIAYLITIMLGIFSVNFVASTLIVPGDDALSINNIMENEWLFRIGVASEIMMYLLVVLLASSLYIVLKTVNKNLALLALLWRVGEAIIGAGVTVLSGLIPLQLLNRESSFETEQLQALVGLFLNVRVAGLDIVLIFIGVGGTIFCYLLFKSKYVPRVLAIWGIVTYLSMLIVSFAGVIVPDLPETIKMAFYAPGGLFEIIFGLWLLIKGINVEEWEKSALESTKRKEGKNS